MKHYLKKAAALLSCGLLSCSIVASSMPVYAEDGIQEIVVGDDIQEEVIGDAEIIGENENTGDTEDAGEIVVEPEPDTPAPESIQLPAALTVELGEEHSLDVTIMPENAAAVLHFTSSKPEVAEVTADGILRTHAVGKATIRVTVDGHPELTAKCKVKVVLAAPKHIKVTGETEGDARLKVKWSKSVGALRYDLYRRKRGGAWVKVAATTKTSYIDNNTKGGVTYTYKAVAVAQKEAYDSATSKTVTVKIPNKPYGMMIIGITNKGINYYWKKPDNVTGYVIYRAYKKNGPYVKVTDIKDSTIGDYVDSTFDHGKNYVFYKIRSYREMEDGGRVYSKYTAYTAAAYRSSLKLSRTKLFVRSKESRQLHAYFGWGNAASLKWYSSNPKVATVSSDGKVTGVSAGTCTIRCYSAQLGISKTCTVTIDRAPLPMLGQTSSIPKEYRQKSEGYWVKKNKNREDNALIMMVGDMMCTGAQQGVQGYATGNYNFNDSFSQVKGILSGADLAVGNLETTLSSSWPYMHEEGYIDTKPNCNAPNRYLDAVRYAGIDGVVMANNHNCDAGVHGLKDTIEQVDRYEFARTGVFADSSDTRYMIFDVNGIKVGYVSYVSPLTGYNGKDAEWSEGQKNRYLNYYTKEKAERDLKAMRAAGAEYCIPFMHWGIKNAGVKQTQWNEAQELADLGYDYIVGSHAHLLQEYTTITSADGREIPCFFSLGDFQASVDQITGNRDSAILRIRLKRAKDGSIRLAQNNYIPCYTYTKLRGNNYVTVEVKSKTSATAKRIQTAIGNKIKRY